jgi:hypothetical protein
MEVVRKHVEAYPHIHIEKTPHPTTPKKTPMPKFIPITPAEKSKCSWYINMISTSHTDLKTRHYTEN